MKTIDKVKKGLKIGVIYGLLFAVGMSVFDFYNDKSFSLISFVFNFIIFTFFIVLKEVYLINKREKKEKSK